MNIQEKVTKLKHIKRGTEYYVVASGKLQTDKPIEDYEELVAYLCVQTGDVWFRPKSEITPDRFETTGEGYGLLPVLLFEGDNKLTHAIHSLKKISNMEVNATLPWTHERAADTYMWMVDSMKLEAKATLEKLKEK